MKSSEEQVGSDAMSPRGIWQWIWGGRVRHGNDIAILKSDVRTQLYAAMTELMHE